MAKTWPWAFLDRHNTSPQSFSSPHKIARQFTSNSNFTSNYDQFKNPKMEQADSKPADPGVVEYLLMTEMGIKKVDIDAGSSSEAGVTQSAPSNGTPSQTNTNEQHVSSSSEPRQSPTQTASQEEKQKETEIGLEKETIPKTPKTPVLSRLPTPDLSDLECGSFCACCGDTEEGDGIDVKK